MSWINGNQWISVPHDDPYLSLDRFWTILPRNFFQNNLGDKRRENRSGTIDGGRCTVGSPNTITKSEGFMICERSARQGGDDQLEMLASELASTAYAVVLKQKREISWLDLELELWRALTESVRKAVHEQKVRQYTNPN